MSLGGRLGAGKGRPAKIASYLCLLDADAVNRCSYLRPGLRGHFDFGESQSPQRE